MEPDIAPLAKRLAEENNVSWQQLNGSGANGKIVERDVLEYLARVMAGEEALNPTAEPVPEGMEAWPEEDAQGFAVKQAAPVSTMVEDPPDNLLDTGLDDLLDVSEDAFLADFSDDFDVFAGATSEATDDEDIFLFDDDLSESSAKEDDFTSSLMAEAEIASEEDANDAFAATEFEDSFELDIDDEDEFSVQASQSSQDLDDLTQDVDDLMFAEEGSAELSADLASDSEFGNDLFATGFNDNLDLDEDLGSLFNDDSSANEDETLDLKSDDDFGVGVLADLLPDNVFSDDFSLMDDSDDSEFEGLEDSFVDLSEDLDSDELELSGDFEAETSAFTDPSEDDSADMFLADDSDQMDDLFDTDLLSADVSTEDDSLGDLLDDSLSVSHEVDSLFQEDRVEFFEASEASDDLFAESELDRFSETAEELEAAPDSVSEDLFEDDFVELSVAEAVEVLDAVEDTQEQVSVVDVSADEVVEVEAEADAVVFEGEDLAAEELELEVAAETVTEEVTLESRETAKDAEFEPLPVIAAPVSQESLAVAAPSVVIRRYIDVSSLDQVRAVVAKELKQENLSYDAFLLRAAAKVFGEKVAVLSIDDEGFSAKQGNALSGALRNTVTALENAEVLADLSQLDLVVVDISSYGLDEIVLNAGVAVLSLGRTTVDEAQAKQMTSLALSGDISVAKAAKQLAELAELLSQPLGLIV